MSKAIESKKKICEAAITVAARDGFSSMSLDAVAKQAGVSKGGLLYHYGTKDDLIEAMLSHFAEAGRTMMLERIAADPTPGMRWARGFVTCLFPSDDELESSKHDIDPSVLSSFMLSMLTAASDRSTNVAPLTEISSGIRDQLLEEDGGLEQLMVWLAMDGLLVWQLLGLIDRDDPLFEEIGDAFRDRVGLPPRSKATKKRSKNMKQRSKTKKTKKPKAKTTKKKKTKAAKLGRGKKKGSK